MRVGIVGCGLNSDYHIDFSKAYPGTLIAGVADQDEAKARECAEKHNIHGIYSTIKELIEQAHPEVVHILTPPKTHYALAKEAIELNRHVLLEKPMTLTGDEARSLFDLADVHGVKLCTMHNHFFDPCMEKAKTLIAQGRVGTIVNVESTYGINTQISAFRDYPHPNVLPWLYELPGGVFHDFMPHPLYVLLEYTGRPKAIQVMSQEHGVLPHHLPDEIRILIDGEKALGTVTFSFAAQPHLHSLRIHGTRMMVEVDFNTMTTLTHPVSRLPKAAQKATHNLSESAQLLISTTRNVLLFLLGRLRPYQGMKTVIHRFYDAIRNDTLPVPVSMEQTLAVIDTMDKIWKQLEYKPFNFSPITYYTFPYPIRQDQKVLVTGGTGFLGRRLVELLVQEEFPVRVLARKLSHIDCLKKLGVEIFYGDVADAESLGSAMDGVHVVVHAAAGTSGSLKDSETGTLHGTRNILKQCEDAKIKKLIYISSCSVYGVADYKPGQVVTEESSLERFPEQRGTYSASKQKAEQYVTQAIKDKKFPIVVLRPGTVIGPGGELFTPMMGMSLFNKLFMVIGDGSFQLPVVSIDNLADAIIKAILSDRANGEIFNIVDENTITKRKYMDKVIRAIYPDAFVFYFPYSLFTHLIVGQEKLFEFLKRRPILTRYRLVSSQTSVRYDSSKIVQALNWKPTLSVAEAMERIVQSQKGK